MTTIEKEGEERGLVYIPSAVFGFCFFGFCRDVAILMHADEGRTNCFISRKSKGKVRDLITSN